ncbi:M23 family metallopeptidase [uncultured Campylobacter sp.]|uniref:M23 family metallopeptidase n=1 Tax=uncultured Campylobacter sp. TaxID=218934 RepID=UPI00260C44B1|nr:M23 family metallopeptidase [uncultured Campylobacter sp.]
MFRKVALSLIFAPLLFATSIINGDSKILSIKCQNSGKLFLDGRQIEWIKSPINSDYCFAIVPVHYYKKGEVVVEHLLNQKSQKVVLKIEQGDYKKEKVVVDKSKIKPPKEVEKRIKKEFEEASLLYAKTTKKFLFKDKFIKPMDSTITSEFGNARVFNGLLKSYHSGVDFRAAVGSKVVASNDGVVVLAKERYYAGKSVVIDHGGGIYSQYYHLSKIKTKLGKKVKRGEVIGLSGATGRVSGAHLHFGITINGVSVNPLLFIERINYAIFDYLGEI